MQCSGAEHGSRADPHRTTSSGQPHLACRLPAPMSNRCQFSGSAAQQAAERAASQCLRESCVHDSAVGGIAACSYHAEMTGVAGPLQMEC